MTQQQLADIVGIKKASISGLELGASKNPSALNLLPIARTLGVSPEWLVTGKGSMMPGTEGSRLSPDVNDLANKYLRLTDAQKSVIRAVMDEMSPPK